MRQGSPKPSAAHALAAFVALAAALVLPGLAQAKDGKLDTSFGTGGKVTTTFSGGGSAAYGVAMDSQGRYITVGVSVSGGAAEFALARYDSDGNIDTSFGTGGTGKVTTALGSQAYARSVVIDSQGR